MKAETYQDGHEQPKTRNLVLTVMLVAGVPLLVYRFYHHATVW